MRRPSWAWLMCTSLSHVLLFAQSPDNRQNLSACTSGSAVCDFALLTQAEASAVGAAEHQRSFLDCKNAVGSCDYSKLTVPEARAVAVAEHERNFSNCSGGFGTCNYSKLTQREEAQWPLPNASAISQIAAKASEPAT